MKGTKLQERAAARTQELPGTQLEHPFGEDWDVYKVRGKVFMLLTEVTGEPIVVLKATPADNKALQQIDRRFRPGTPQLGPSQGGLAAQVRAFNWAIGLGSL